MDQPEELMKSWIRLCTDPRTSADLLEKAAYWESINHPKDFTLRLAVAKHRSAGPEILSKLSMVKNLSVQIAVAAHGNLSESTAAKLLKMQVRELRRSLAGNPSIPVFVMQKLARDFTDVRVRLAKNPSLPAALQKRLSNEREAVIRRSLCLNRRLHPTIMARLARDKESEVRLAIVDHPDIPRGGLLEMAQDISDEVREAVFARAAVDFTDARDIFKALSKGKDATAEDARRHLDELDLAEKSAAPDNNWDDV